MGTITDKLTYLSSTKARLKRAINIRGGTIESGDTFRSYVAQIQSLVWAPDVEFLGGVQGLWFTPKDMSTLFQNAAGTTPVTASGNPIGLVTDQSGNGNSARQSVADRRPIYPHVNGDGADDMLWVFDNIAGGHNFTMFGETVSFSARITPDDITAAGVVPWASGRTLVCLRDRLGTSTYTVSFCFGIDAGKLNIGAKNTAGATDGAGFKSTASLAVGAEVTVGFTLNGMGVELYIDGVLDSSGTLGVAANLPRNVGNNIASLSLLARTTNTGTATSQFDGDCKGMILTNSVFSAADHLAMHNYFANI